MRKTALPPGPGSAISPGASWPAPLSLAHFSPSGPAGAQSFACQQVLKSQGREHERVGLCWVPLIPFPRSYQAMHQQFPACRSRALGRVIVCTQHHGKTVCMSRGRREWEPCPLGATFCRAGLPHQPPHSSLSVLFPNRHPWASLVVQ